MKAAASEHKAATFVLDASVTVAWCFLDEQSKSAASVLDALEKGRAIVPALWAFEVGNVLRMGELRKRSTKEDTMYWLEFLSKLPIVIDDCIVTGVWEKLLDLAREQRITVYDAAYLELARRLSLPLATLDRHLASAAKKAGVALYRA